jgi:hypothetical protein
MIIKVYAEIKREPDYKLVKSLYSQLNNLVKDSTVCFSKSAIKQLVVDSYKERKGL